MALTEQIQTPTQLILRAALRPFRATQLAAIAAACTLALSPTFAFADADADQDSFWTEFVPSIDTRLIFVSQERGNDSHSGLNPDAPVKTLAKAYSLLRDGHPDWMLLKRGDTWNESLPNWGKSGRSESEMMIVGAYGDDPARPQIRPEGDTIALHLYGTEEISYTAFVGLHIEPLNRADDQGGSGVRLLASSHDILFEDLYVSGFAGNFILQEFSGSTISDIRLNGCIIVDAWSNSTHSQGLYAEGLDGLTIENCVFDHNGFNEGRNAEPTIFNHNLYIQNGTENVVVRGNIISNASSHGVQLRPGGIIEDNLFISNPLAILLGGGTHPDEGGVSGQVQRNLIMYGRGISPTLPRSFGITASNINQAIFNNNFFYSSEIGYNGDVIALAGDRDLMLKNVTVEHNSVINWHGSISISSPVDGQTFENIVLRNNYIYRDLTANGGNGNFNKPFLSSYSGHESAVSLSDNSYTYYGMHNRPFKIGDTNISTDSWINEYEPSGKIQSSNQPPSGFELEDYMSSVNLQGGKNEFISHARNRSRQSMNIHITPLSVYSWFEDIIPE